MLCIIVEKGWGNSTESAIVLDFLVPFWVYSCLFFSILEVLIRIHFNNLDDLIDELIRLIEVVFIVSWRKQESIEDTSIQNILFLLQKYFKKQRISHTYNQHIVILLNEFDGCSTFYLMVGTFLEKLFYYINYCWNQILVAHYAIW